MGFKIVNSKQVMTILSISENTLLKYEHNGIIEVDFRLGNRKRYYLKNMLKSLEKLSR